MQDVLVVAVVIVIAIAYTLRGLEQLGAELPWVPLAAVVVVGLFLLRAIPQAVARARAKALRRRARAARRRWLAGMVRLSREELFRLQAAWAAIERAKALDPNDPGYGEVQEAWRQAVEFVRKLRTLAASQGKRVPESSAECHQVLWFWAKEDPRASELRDTVGRPDAEPEAHPRAFSMAWVTGGLYHRLRAVAIGPRVVAVGGSVLLAVALIAGAGRSAWWEAVGLVLAGGLIGAALALWRHTKTQEP